MKRTLIILACLLLPLTAFSFELTQEHVTQAESARAAAVSMGLHKATPEQMVDTAMEMVTFTESKPRELTKEEKKSMTCMMKYVLEMQFKSDITEYARFLHDESYREEMNKKWEKKCKVY